MNTAKHRKSNNENEDNIQNTWSDKDYWASSQKFWQMDKKN